MSDAPRFVEVAQELGLNGQEALLLEALLARGDMTGYEAAREAGISRSNAYHALAALVAKGFAYRSEADPPVYSAVAPQEAAAVVRARLERSLEGFLATAPARRAPAAPFLTIAGRSLVLERMALMIDGAVDRVYVSMARDDVEALRQPLLRAVERGIKVVLVGPAGPEIPGAVRHVSRKERGRVRVIADGALVLAGELSARGGACVYSRNEQLVGLIKDSLTDEIELVQAGGRA